MASAKPAAVDEEKPSQTAPTAPNANGQEERWRAKAIEGLNKLHSPIAQNRQ
jgi:hypothetical protein